MRTASLELFIWNSWQFSGQLTLGILYALIILYTWNTLILWTSAFRTNHNEIVTLADPCHQSFIILDDISSNV